MMLHVKTWQACSSVPGLLAPGRVRPTRWRAKPLAASTDSADSEEVIPEVGWMWQTGPGKASATRASLKQANIKAKKSLGQNFLTDERILADIVAAAGVRKGDLVLEVGPGTGNLTRHLVGTGAHVTAVEKDDVLVERLREEFKEASNLQLLHSDVLRVGIDQVLEGMLAQSRMDAVQVTAEAHAAPSTSTSSSNSSAGPAARQQRRVKVVANLPYNITKEFLQLMLPKGDLMSELSIMIQEEPARRLVNKKPGASDYRAMSVYTHFYSRPKYRFRIPKDKYFPAPNVDGALVTFALLPSGRRLPVPSERGFVVLVNKAFSERRKMMRNSLQPLYSTTQVAAALEKAGHRPDARAQDLSVEEFVRFYSCLHELTGKEALANDYQGHISPAAGEEADGLVATLNLQTKQLETTVL